MYVYHACMYAGTWTRMQKAKHLKPYICVHTHTHAHAHRHTHVHTHVLYLTHTCMYAQIPRGVCKRRSI